VCCTTTSSADSDTRPTAHCHDQQATERQLVVESGSAPTRASPAPGAVLDRSTSTTLSADPAVLTTLRTIPEPQPAGDVAWRAELRGGGRPGGGRCVATAWSRGHGRPVDGRGERRVAGTKSWPTGDFRGPPATPTNYVVAQPGSLCPSPAHDRPLPPGSLAAMACCLHDGTVRGPGCSAGTAFRLGALKHSRRPIANGEHRAIVLAASRRVRGRRPEGRRNARRRGDAAAPETTGAAPGWNLEPSRERPRRESPHCCSAFHVG